MNNRTKRLTYWSGLNKQWELSGLPQQRFCEQQGVVYKQFVYWRMQVIKHNKSNSLAPRLLKVSAPVGLTIPKPETLDSLEVILPTGIKLYIQTAADVRNASALIRQLGGAL